VADLTATSTPPDAMRTAARLMWARTRSDLQYRLSFSLRVGGAVITMLTDVVGLWALEHRFGAIGGWTLWPLLLLYGTASMSFRIGDAFIGGAVEQTAEYVRTGKLDTLLTRPVGVMTQLVGEAFAPRRIGQMLAAVPFFALGLIHCDIEWTPLRVAIAIAMVVNAVIVFTAIFTIANTLSFWSPNTVEVANAFTYGGQTASQYPIHVMDRWVRGITLSIVPVAFAVYLPSFLLLSSSGQSNGAPNPLGITTLHSSLSLLACIPLALLAAFIWRTALRTYQSTGS
jgi:ABC-2 type transport system permease protein